MSASALEVGTKLVSLCSAGKGMEAIETLYDEKVVSIEAQEAEGMAQRMEGLEAIKGKNTWWYDNHEVHSSTAEGPFCGHKPDQFAVRFEMDVTFKPSGERSNLVEMGLFTVKDGKVVEEEFWYRMD